MHRERPEPSAPHLAATVFFLASATCGYASAQEAPPPPTQQAEGSVHPSEVLGEMTGLGAGVSRAIARVIRTTENAIPVIVDAKVRSPRSGGEVVVGYEISLNEACVRDLAPEGRAALRAAREACRSTRGIEYTVAAIRCTAAPRGADACASTELLWTVALAPGTSDPAPRDYRQSVYDVRLTDRNLDADAETELVVDYLRDESYSDPGDTRSGGEVMTTFLEAVVVDDDGSVISRVDLVEGPSGGSGEHATYVHARLVGDSIRFAVSRCTEPSDECPVQWSPPHALVHEPVVRPTVAATPPAPSPAGG